MMTKIMHFLFLSCFKATKLIEKKFHFKLTLREKLQLKMHTMMCDACSMYEKQSEIIEQGIQNKSQEKLYNEADIKKLKQQIKLKIENTKH